MNKNNRKISVVLLSIAFLMQLLIPIIYGKGIKLDLFFFYEHERYLTNILHEVSLWIGLLAVSILSIYESRKEYRVLIGKFTAIWVLIELLDYFLFYRQLLSIIKVPAMAIIYVYLTKQLTKQ